MKFTNLIFEIKNSIGYITIDRETKLNALNNLTMKELSSLFREIKSDDSIKAIIITGKGEKAFVAGADISELNKLDKKTGEKFAEFGQSVFNQIEKLGKPVIAAVNGYALGGGCELALACHIRLASENVMFGQPEVNLGIIPGFGGTQRLTHLINSGRALEYILTGDMINAQTALAIGLVNKIFPREKLLDGATEMCLKILSKGPIAVKLSLESVQAAVDLPLEQGLAVEADLFGDCCGSEDFKEGTSAFLEKRKTNFINK